MLPTAGPRAAVLTAIDHRADQLLDIFSLPATSTRTPKSMSAMLVELCRTLGISAHREKITIVLGEVAASRFR